MKYLKRIDEELDRQTYISAAKKLQDLKHTNRYKKLLEWPDISKWNEKKRDYSKFGEIKVSLNGKIGDFYVFFIFDTYAIDSFDIKQEKKGSFWLPIGLIPKDDAALAICKEKIKDSDEFSGGFYWAFSMGINFDATDHITYTGVYFDAYDPGVTGPVKIADRRSAVTLKRIITNAIGDPNYNYPSDLDRYSNMSEQIDLQLGSSLSMGSDYGFNAIDLSDYIKSLSVNIFYQD